MFSPSLSQSSHNTSHWHCLANSCKFCFRGALSCKQNRSSDSAQHIAQQPVSCRRRAAREATDAAVISAGTPLVILGPVCCVCCCRRDLQGPLQDLGLLAQPNVARASSCASLCSACCSLLQHVSHYSCKQLAGVRLCSTHCRDILDHWCCVQLQWAAPSPALVLRSKLQLHEVPSN